MMDEPIKKVMCLLLMTSFLVGPVVLSSGQDEGYSYEVGYALASKEGYIKKSTEANIDSVETTQNNAELETSQESSESSNIIREINGRTYSFSVQTMTPTSNQDDSSSTTENSLEEDNNNNEGGDDSETDNNNEEGDGDEDSDGDGDGDGDSSNGKTLPGDGEFGEHYLIPGGDGDGDGDGDPDHTLQSNDDPIIINPVTPPEDDGPHLDQSNDNVVVRRIPRTCFLAGTKVAMADGSCKNIEEINVGDIVKSYNTFTKEITDGKVVDFFYFETEKMADYYIIINDDLKVTPEHPIYQGGKWVRADDLKEGDLVNIEDNPIIINSLQKIYNKVPTYNFEVKTFHNYMVQINNEDLLVHNAQKESAGSAKATCGGDDDDPDIGPGGLLH